MKKINYMIMVIASITMIISCGSVNSTVKDNTDLNKYRSYSLVENEEGFLPQVNPVQKEQIEKAINDQIASISASNSGVTGPDILVSYFVVIDTKQDVETYTTYYGRRWRNQIIEVDVNEYKEGTLILDFVDAKTKEIVWNGSISGTVTNNSISLEKKINDAVDDLFKKYKKDQILIK